MHFIFFIVEIIRFKNAQRIIFFTLTLVQRVSTKKNKKEKQTNGRFLIDGLRSKRMS